MAGKLSAAVTARLQDSDYIEAQNLALVSCVFAREINCVEGRAPLSPTPELAIKPMEPPAEAKRSVVIMGGGPVRCTDAWQQIQQAVLQANHEVKGLSDKTYERILKGVLPEPSLAKLAEIRARSQHWPKVEETLR